MSFSLRLLPVIAVTSLLANEARADDHVEPAPGQAAAAAPSPSSVHLTATCSLGDHEGVDPAEARTAADLICHDLALRGATNTEHEVRFGKLGGRTMVTLASRRGNAYDERRTFVTALDEIEVAGPRLVTALVEDRTVAETRNVDNILANETRMPRRQQGTTFVSMGMFGASSIGSGAAPSAGFELGLGYRVKNLGVYAAGRAGGIGSADDKLSMASVDVGGRLHAADGDVAPFVGAGFVISYFHLGRPNDDLSGSGIGAYAAVGVEMLRSHHVGVSVAGRIDAPFYALEGSGTSSRYVMPVSFTLALAFR